MEENTYVGIDGTSVDQESIIFPERTWNFTPRKKRTSENQGNETLQRHSLPQAQIC